MEFIRTVKDLFCKMKIFQLCVGRYNSAERQQIVILLPSAGEVATSDANYWATKTQAASNHRGTLHVGSISVFTAVVLEASKKIRSLDNLEIAFLNSSTAYVTIPQQQTNK